MVIASAFGPAFGQEPEGEADSTVIEGQVFNLFGAGVENVRVTVTQPQAGQAAAKELAVATTDGMGDFRITIGRRIAGEVTVSFSAPGYADATRQVTIDPDDDFPPFVDLELAGAGTLAGLVLDARNQAPIAGAKVRVELAFKEFTAESDSKGVFEIGGLLPGDVGLTVEADGFAREKIALRLNGAADGKIAIQQDPKADPQIRSAAVIDDAGRLSIGLKPERIVHLRIVNDDDKPVAGALVECLDDDRSDFRTLAADDEGKLTIRGLRYDGKQLALRLTHDQYVSSQEFDRIIDFPPDTAESEHTLVMHAAGTLTGTITEGESGRPLNGARIIVGQDGQERSCRDWTGFDGRYTITGVMPGPQVVTVHLVDHAPELRRIEVKAGNTATLDIALVPPGAVGGVVVDQDGEPLGGAHVMTTKWREAATLGLQAMTDANGRFYLVNAPHDEFEIIIAHPHYEPLKDQAVQSPRTDYRFQMTAATSGPGSMPGVKVAVGDDAPAIDLVSLDGKPIKSADFKGKTVLLDFWATWCGPCVAELPHVKAVQEAFGKRDDFLLIGISLDQDEAAVRKFVHDKKIDWPQAMGKKGGAEQAAETYGVYAIPATFLIGPDGKILAIDLNGSAMKDAVGKALAR